MRRERVRAIACEIDGHIGNLTSEVKRHENNKDSRAIAWLLEQNIDRLQRERDYVLRFELAGLSEETRAR